MGTVRALMLGDLVGEPGLRLLEEKLAAVVAENGVDFTVINGENAADGFGLTEATLRRILAAGADAVTSGNHVWEKRDFWPVLDGEPRVLRPANYPPAVAGRGFYRFVKAGTDWLVLNLQGRELMSPIDCPFRCLDALLESEGHPAVVLVDFHAESAREKEALGYHAAGRVSLVAGTHTHVATADERILPGGTAYITDLGMTGITDSVIGMDTRICLERTRKQVLYRMEPAATGTARLQGVIAEIDGETGRAVSVKRLP